MTVRVAVIGAGIMGSDHARVIAEEIPGATLQVVCDVSEAAARTVADTCGAAHAGTEIAATTAFEPTAGMADCGKPVVMVMETEAGQLVTVEVNNNAAYGYDVRGEVVSTEGAVSLGRPVGAVVDAALGASTAYPADWRPRFQDAYRLQNKAWIQSIVRGAPAPDAASAWDGYCATVVAEAGAKALETGQRCSVDLVERPQLYQHLGEAA